MRIDRMLEGGNDQILLHRFPSDMQPAQIVELTISGVISKLLNAEGLALTLPKKQKNNVKIERFSTIKIDFGQKFKIQSLHANLTTSEITCIGQPNSPIIIRSTPPSSAKATLITYYKKENGKNKILHAYFNIPGRHYLQIEKALSIYDQIFCIDTNSKTTKDGRVVSVTTAIIGSPKTLADSALWIGETVEYQAVAYDPPGNPEIYGIWMCFCHIYKDRPDLLKDKIALITDTEYDKISSWQNRTEAFFEGHKLPDGIDIFYATSDAGIEEFLPNKLIKMCDKMNDQKIREFLSPNN